MGSSTTEWPAAVIADESGEIVDLPGVRAVARVGARIQRIDPNELIALPEGSNLYLLPGRRALGWHRGRLVPLAEGLAVAANLPAGYLSLALPAWHKLPGAPSLPLLAYTATCWYRDTFQVPAIRIESDIKHDPQQFDEEAVAVYAGKRREEFKGNRLAEHLIDTCALKYGCANALNFLYGRWECPLPISPGCNAGCIGCISNQPDGHTPAAQERIRFVPTVDEIVEIAVAHLERAEKAMVSFGQGCEGEPLTQEKLLCEAIKAIRQRTNAGVIHLNTNGSKPEVIRKLRDVGLDSIRISTNSARAGPYEAYFKPVGYKFDDVVESIKVSVETGLFTSINYLTFPGFTDSPAEFESLARLIELTGLHMIQWRNLNIDPDVYLSVVPVPEEKPLGLLQIIKRLRERFPEVRHGTLNPPRECWS